MAAARTLASIACVLTLLLAGCSDGGGKSSVESSTERGEGTFDPDSAEEHFDDYDLDATSTTGLIRGVVVDTALRTVAAATVTVEGGETKVEFTTDELGSFGVDGLAPGTYFVKARKAGYTPSQTSVDVEADVDDPDVVTVRLEADASLVPYVDSLKWEGFIQCSVRFVVNALAACATIPGGSDNFLQEYPLERTPDWAQSEMVWETTQAAGESLKVQYTDFGVDPFVNYVVAVGESPLLLMANKTVLEDHTAADNPLTLRVFTGSLEGTNVVPGFEGVSLTVNQEFTIFTHLFYNALPAEGWRFSDSGEPELPGA